MMKEYKKQQERDLKLLGFKKHKFPDGSGGWFEKDFKFKKMKMRFVFEINRLFILQIQTSNWSYGKLNKKNYEDVLSFKYDLDTVKKTIKEFK